MALWLNRAGKNGEYEAKFLDDNRIYITWNDLKSDLSRCKNRTDVRHILAEAYPDNPLKKLIHHSGQLWQFVSKMHEGDWIVCPSKRNRSIHVGEIVGPYVFDAQGQNPYFHYRDVKWLGQDIPRTNFDQDILYSFGSAMTICQIERNDAEKRVRAMLLANWKRPGIQDTRRTGSDNDLSDLQNQPFDLDQIAKDQIARLIMARFKGHDLERLVAAVLQAQGYTIYHSPKGTDGGLDVLAAAGPLGFGLPKICVQVKSEDAAISRSILDQLIGVMAKVQADHGLLVAWGGFRNSFEKDKAAQFFKVRLWNQEDLIEQILINYDRLDPDIRTELPLKRIWVIARPDNESDE